MAYASYIIDASKKSKYTMFVKEITVMSFENYFPLWNDLNTAQKNLISDNLITQHVKKGTIIHNGNMDCTGYVSYTHLDVYKRQTSSFLHASGSPISTECIS